MRDVRPGHNENRQVLQDTASTRKPCGISIAIKPAMQLRRVHGCALLLVAACGHDTSPIDPDAAIGPDGAILDGGVADSAPDSGGPLPDGSPDDETPPTLVAITPGPGDDVWLHEPFRFQYDEPLGAGGTVTATLAGAAVSATITREGDRTLVVSVDPAAAGIGALALRVTGVRDLAGNVAAAADGAFTLGAWSTPPADRGAAASSPVLAVADSGAVIAAWTVGAVGSRRLVVSMRERGTWLALGGPLGAADASSPSVALEPAGIVVAWVENGAARAARWTGTWTDLPSPGSGSRVALAGGPEVVAATFGSSVAVRRLSGSTWQAVGTDLALGGSVIGAPSIALAAAGKPVVGWITQASTTVTLRVHRFGTGWSALAPIAFAAPPSGTTRMSLAARGADVAIAWDQYSGSSSVYVARSSTTTWSRLGRTLDIDVAGDASAPAIAIDATGAPIVAWRERVETAERGAVARWTSNAWKVVGGASWLASGTTPTATTIALHKGRAHVVGFSVNGAIAVARWNGPRVAGPGMTSRPSLAGCSFSANPPARLLQTGCFTIPAAGKATPHAGLVPYDIVAELWTDGAKKRRWIALPAGQAMTASANGSWAAPTGTFVVKEFAYESTPGNPATRRVVETRFLIKTATGWLGFTYEWRANGTDADLLNDGQYTHDWPLDGGGTYRHVYPSQSQCLSCHHGSQGPLLGIRSQQLARWMDYNGKIAEQLPTLAAIGVGPGTAVTPYIAPHDASATFEQRTRGYMAANCAHCHNPNNIAVKDLRYSTPLASTNLCSSIVPGSPSQSVVYARVTQRPGMPPLGTLAPDPLAEHLLGSWISGMTSCP